MKLSITLLFLFFIFSISHSYSQESENKVWTLQDCIEYAWDNNLVIKQQELGVGLAEQNLLQSRGNLFPTLNANASHGYNYGRTVDPFTNEFATESVQTNNFSISSGLTLFSGLQILNSIRQSKLELEASKYDVESVRNDIALAIASAYLQILYSIEMVEVNESQLEITKQQIERTKKLVESGAQPKGTLFNIEAQLASEELQLINAKNRLDLAYLDLIQLLDIKEADSFEISIPEVEITDEDKLEYTPLEMYSVAVSIQPEIKSSDIKVESAKKGLSIAKGGRSPMLSLRGAYGSGYSGASREVTEVIMGEPTEIGVTATGVSVYAPSFEYETRIKPFNDQLEDNLNRNFGLYLTIPIFNNFQVSSSVAKSKINVDNAKITSQRTRDQLFKTIQQAHADASAALKRFHASEVNVKALQESFRYIEQRFNVGMVNHFEYNDAKNRLVAAESEMLQSKYEYIFRIRILDFYIGNPIEL
ncbi:MAG: TolC family protein [Bacteroidales bacterium]